MMRWTELKDIQMYNTCKPLPPHSKSGGVVSDKNNGGRAESVLFFQLLIMSTEEGKGVRFMIESVFDEGNRTSPRLWLRPLGPLAPVKK